MKIAKFKKKMPLLKNDIFLNVPCIKSSISHFLRLLKNKTKIKIPHLITTYDYINCKLHYHLIYEYL